MSSKAYGGLFICFILSTFNFDLVAQVLTIEETISYLENRLNNHLSTQEIFFGEKKSISIEIENNETIHLKYIYANLEEAITPEFYQDGINYNLISFDLNDVYGLEAKTINGKYAVTLKCNDNSKDCFKMQSEAIEWHFSEDFCDRPSSHNHFDYLHLFYLDNFIEQEKIFNAFYYLLNRLRSTKGEKKIEDPFDNNKNSLEVENRNSSSREIVSLYDNYGVSNLEVSLAGYEYEAILDSGASDLSIPKSIENLLLSKGVIDKSDYSDPALYMIADGSVVMSARFKLPYIKVGNIRIKNISCSVNQSDDIILLGNSFLDSFKSWKIDNENKKLILEY